MKKILLSLVALFFSVYTFAQTTDKMSYQAVVRNSNNEIVANKKVGIRISILQGSFDGTAVYSETQTPTTNANGLISIVIGEGTTSNNFSAINWSSGTHFIQTEIDPLGGTNYTITGISQLLSVPYSFHAKTADVLTAPIIELDPSFNAWNKNYLDLINRPDIPGLIEKDAVTLKTAQLITGEKVFKGKITVNDPTEPSEPATKDYVDTQLQDMKKMMDIFNEKYAVNLPPMDVTGKVYSTVKIGTQTWMAENLSTRFLNDGTMLKSDDIYSFENEKEPAYTLTNLYYENEKYGAMYNGVAVMTGKLCPAGWHIPTTKEFDVLINYLRNNGYTYNGSNKNSGVAKSLVSQIDWAKSDVVGSPGNWDYPFKRNLSGFNALPAGTIGSYVDSTLHIRYGFIGSTYETNFWSYEPGVDKYTSAYSLSFDKSTFLYTDKGKYSGNPVRCIKD